MAGWLTCSGAGVVCLGADGHIAVEPAFHSHCGCCEGEEGPSPSEGPNLTSPCPPCTDIPIPGAPADLGKVQQTTVTNFDMPPSASGLMDSLQTPGEGRRGFCYSYFSPLKDIILLT